MRSFAEAWPEREIVQGPLAQITWYHASVIPESSDENEPIATDPNSNCC